jgi:5-formyltetrahydrofolate cyclo-ligase
MTNKKALRAEALRRLRSIEPAERAAASQRIAERLWRVPEVAAARTLLAYASLPEEVDTWPIVEEAWRRGVSVLFPRCETESRTLRLFRTTEAGIASELSAGTHGIREPDPDRCDEAAFHEVDVVLVPGLGWDRRGARLGRGAGYYDRLLADPDRRAFACGVFFAAQEFERLPTDPWDVPLDAIVTERGQVTR